VFKNNQIPEKGARQRKNDAMCGGAGFKHFKEFTARRRKDVIRN
jgi:hypothetical protein